MSRGERDPENCATQARAIRASHQEIARRLEGTWPRSAIRGGQSLELYDTYQKKYSCDQRITNICTGGGKVDPASEPIPEPLVWKVATAHYSPVSPA